MAFVDLTNFSSLTGNIYNHGNVWGNLVCIASVSMWFGRLKEEGRGGLSILQNCKEILATQAKENQSAAGFTVCWQLEQRP